ncbi:hypothetical protein R1sor_001390 [Riccia sorocarpa]|uniref:Uncharacterized protein n=1 Tax=Riccia sorocarpa TaxID=122646 RepID=A0ABD3GW53_9MARC
MAMEEHTRVWKFWASLEDQLAQVKKEEEVLKAKISDLEEEKRLMNERVAMMEKKDLYELLEAKMQGKNDAAPNSDADQKDDEDQRNRAEPAPATAAADRRNKDTEVTSSYHEREEAPELYSLFCEITCGSMDELMVRYGQTEYCNYHQDHLLSLSARFSRAI